MRATPKFRARRNAEGGYALLMVLFLMATMLVFAAVGTMSTLTEGQREKETELAWRGNQYVRAVRLYYRKNGRFPSTIEDLTKYHTDQPRFIRQAYKDPMNTDDGSWRLIYVLPNGQLVGSVMHKALQGSLMSMVPAAGNPLGGSSTGGQNAAPGPGQSTFGQQQNQTPGQTPATNQPTPMGQDQSGNQGQVFGGSLIGFGSKVKKPSIRVYQNGTTYYEWEFIYDPTARTGVAGGGQAPTTPPATAPGTGPATQPPSGPGTTPPNSQQ
jgi:hypothetical protein